MPMSSDRSLRDRADANSAMHAPPFESEDYRPSSDSAEAWSDRPQPPDIGGTVAASFHALAAYVIALLESVVDRKCR
jgi:hypothetical protein